MPNAYAPSLEGCGTPSSNWSFVEERLKDLPRLEADQSTVSPEPPDSELVDGQTLAGGSRNGSPQEFTRSRLKLPESS